MGPLRNHVKLLRFLQLGMVATIILGLVVYFKFGNPRIMIPIRTSDEYFNAVILSMQFSEWYWAARTITVVSIMLVPLLSPMLGAALYVLLGALWSCFAKFLFLEFLKQMIAITVMRACAYVKWNTTK